ncbi:hypothetical protein R1sor_022699 [Riccia sorocarpa]|uniref:F-box domain-containing protein n=1 Tax=Riccia sorocarpa TaxID=122646 RepID=A0ABD3GKN0_9MARC
MASEKKRGSNQPCGEGGIGLFGPPILPLIGKSKKRSMVDVHDGEETHTKKLCFFFDDIKHFSATELHQERTKDTSTLGAGVLNGRKEAVDTAPSTPNQAETAKPMLYPMLYPSSRFEALPVAVLENIVRRISAADLCILSQMSKFCCTLFDKDEFWQMKAKQEGYCRAKSDQNWKFSLKAAASGFLFARSLVDDLPLYYKGDVTVADPMKIFFTGRNREVQRAELLQLLYHHRHEDVVVTYRGFDSAFIWSRQDDDTAFEVTRKSKCVIGEDFAQSGIIAVIPQKLVELLMEENGQSQPVGVFVQDVDGEFRSSHDGDFIIRPATPGSDMSRSLDHEKLAEAEVVCVSGGSWTFSDDSDDEDEYEVTEEDVAALVYEQEGTLSWFDYAERYKHGGGGMS